MRKFGRTDMDVQNQKQKLLNFTLFGILVVFKIFDLFITVFALSLGVIELNPFGYLFYEKPQLILFISFLPIFVGLTLLLFVRKDLFILKIITYGLLAFILLLFFVIVSNLSQLMYML